MAASEPVLTTTKKPSIPARFLQLIRIDYLLTLGRATAQAKSES
jgi:hypothetical protein